MVPSLAPSTYYARSVDPRQTVANQNSGKFRFDEPAVCRSDLFFSRLVVNSWMTANPSIIFFLRGSAGRSKKFMEG